MSEQQNKAIAESKGMHLLQAEIFTAIIEVMALHLKGTICYHGQKPPLGVLALMLKMQKEGFELSEERFNSHVKVMACHGLLHNTAEGDKLAGEQSEQQHPGNDAPDFNTGFNDRRSSN